MPLNKSTGNMYSFITHTWNTIKGECPHGCSYCYMKRWGKQPLLHFDEKEFKTDLGTGNFIFVGSSCDMFADNVPNDWILTTFDLIDDNEHYNKRYGFKPNKYFFQTKNPEKFIKSLNLFDIICASCIRNFVFCTTLETNRFYKDIMQSAPPIFDRWCFTSIMPFEKYITIEPIMDFDLSEFVKIIRKCNPIQVNIGADSNPKCNNLPEPSKGKILALIEELEQFTTVVQKKNLARLLK